ncbi:poly(ADP-ribose) glycohydrolase-like isoform X1 [Ostrinia furnacalis]|uniref:poly(ADP-ribose) glycohydrolase-like isoform X1 n=1 Tax=Ostrinia furnacalis TaxID=93504 RepID=UPI00103D393D|nr:poly(ADP-ribose) glycohydrolase-like isoform X1 [Ostrinia furnacalis]XP_028167885.1 poly(ADP-ribose) glycohydrolase-like isoform X1 [Ostrinia furnacalis]
MQYYHTIQNFKLRGSSKLFISSLTMQHRNRSISLSQQQISSLLANAFFCTFPRRNTTKKESEYASYPFINFNRLFNASPSDSVLEKLKCICHYFRRVCTKVPSGVVTYSRRTVPPDRCPAWAASQRSLAALPLHVDSHTTIEDADGLIQVDFANKFLGGGVLNFGCVQEEIRFVICPELMLSMLFTEMMKPNEALMMIGCERYSKYSGYGGSFHWSGDFKDTTPFDSSGRRRCAVLAIDALPYSSIRHEHTRDMITRELNKAWIGVSYATDESATSLQYPGVATGNWGCGAFGGTPRLKALVQLAACAHARRPVAYYTFGDARLRDDIVAVYNLLARHNVTVGQLYNYIMKYTSTDVRRCELPSFLQQALLDDEAKASNTAPADVTSPGPSNKMDMSEDLSESVLKEFLNESPDLFSQSEYDQDHSMTEVKINMPEPMDESDNRESSMSQDKETKSSTCKPFCNPSYVKEGEDKQNKSSHSELSAKRSLFGDVKPRKSINTEHTSSLLDEMRKFDEENGDLNLTDPVTSLKRSAEPMDASDNKELDKCQDKEKASKNKQSYSSHSLDKIQIIDEDNSKQNQGTLKTSLPTLRRNLFETGVNETQKVCADDKSKCFATLPLKRTAESKLNKSVCSEEERIRYDVTPEAKKKMAMKITDYFSKKSI